MMAGKLIGMQKVIARTAQIVDEVIAVKAVRAIKSANFIIRTEAATMTPVDTSALINSQFDTVEVNGSRITGRVGYSSRYALYVHNASGKLKGQPRAHFGMTSNRSEFGPQKPTAFGGGSLKGNYWDPHGEPKFLLKAGQKTKELVDQIIKKEMALK